MGSPPWTLNAGTIGGPETGVRLHAAMDEGLTVEDVRGMPRGALPAILESKGIDKCHLPAARGLKGRSDGGMGELGV